MVVLVILVIILLHGGMTHLHAGVLGHITLKDGSVLYGEIMGMTNEILQARAASSTSDPISFRWEDIAGISTEGPITLTLENGEMLEGVVESVEQDSIMLRTDQSDSPIPILVRSVVAFHPPKGESTPIGETDEIILKNGHRIPGKIVSMEGKKLKVDTTYAGTLTLKWEDVAQLISRVPLSVEVMEEGEHDDDHFIKTTRKTVQTLADTEDFPLARVKTINIPGYRYKGNFDLGGNRTSGNTDTTAVNASAKATFRWSDRHRVRLSGEYAFGQADGKETANNARGTLRYDYFVTKRLFVPFNQFFEQDQFQGLIIRSTTGIGLGYQFIDTSSHQLSGYIGPAYVYEEFQETGVTTTNTFAWTLDWEYDLISDRVEVFHHQKGFRDYAGRSNALRWVAEQGVRVDVSGDLYLKLEYNYRFNSEPEPGKKESDEAIIWSVGYKFSN